MSIDEKRQRVFIVLCAVFFCSMTLLNVIGITRFVQLGPLALAIGVLPYPLTFLVTDLISELYGRSRANFIVWVGLGLNIFIFTILFLGQWLPGVEASASPPWQVLFLAKPIMLASGEVVEGAIDFYSILYACSAGSMVASMIAYITAQFCDVQLFHFFKKLTKGKHLWLRNNFSTLISQWVDSLVVISVTFGAAWTTGQMNSKALLLLMGSNYLFKMVAALFDTIPFYFLVHRLRKYLQISPQNF